MQTVMDDAARMDRHYRFQRHIYDATRTHYLIGRRPLLAQLEPKPGQCVLEVGCGTAWNLVRAARLYPGAGLYGVDVSNAMLATARQSIGRHGLAGRIHLAQADATRLDTGKAFGIPSFDRVFVSYTLSMIRDWRRAILGAAGAVSVGGELHIVDFGQCERLPRLFKRGLESFLAHYAVTPRADLEAELRKLAERQGFTLRFATLHRGYTVIAMLRRS
jgi:S-adenosylmethionine-diacylgycerolhomoserine-N-methlytransferase